MLLSKIMGQVKNCSNTEDLGEDITLENSPLYEGKTAKYKGEIKYDEKLKEYVPHGKGLSYSIMGPGWEYEGDWEDGYLKTGSCYQALNGRTYLYSDEGRWVGGKLKGEITQTEYHSGIKSKVTIKNNYYTDRKEIIFYPRGTEGKTFRMYNDPTSGNCNYDFQAKPVATVEVTEINPGDLSTLFSFKSLTLPNSNVSLSLLSDGTGVLYNSPSNHSSEGVKILYKYNPGLEQYLYSISNRQTVMLNDDDYIIPTVSDELSLLDIIEEADANTIIHHSAYIFLAEASLKEVIMLYLEVKKQDDGTRSKVLWTDGSPLSLGPHLDNINRFKPERAECFKRKLSKMDCKRKELSLDPNIKLVDAEGNNYKHKFTK